MAFYGDPDNLDSLASQLRASADEVRRRADEMTSRVHDLHWESTAADGFRRMVGEDATSLVQAAGRLDDAAHQLSLHAQTVRERLARIRAIEQAVTGWFGDQMQHLEELAKDAARALTDPIGTVTRVVQDPPWQNWPWTPHNLPDPGDIAWLEVGDFFRRQGVGP